MTFLSYNVVIENQKTHWKEDHYDSTQSYTRRQ